MMNVSFGCNTSANTTAFGQAGKSNNKRDYLQAIQQKVSAAGDQVKFGIEPATTAAACTCGCVACCCAAPCIPFLPIPFARGAF